MQIDFHHGATYVIARLSGFSRQDAGVIAYSAQYVDDATNGGAITFDNGAMYDRLSSAHRMLDYRNFADLANHRVWIPFHFLPGNGGLPAGQDPEGSFIHKLICRPDSPVARDMVRACIQDRHDAFGLHRLGITMHVYADTWAHQGFAGVNHPVNEAGHLTGADGAPDESLMERLKGYFVGVAFPLGHGAVLSNPDKPFLEWAYTDGLGNRVHRNNPIDFMTAASQMAKAMQRYRLGNPDAMVVPGLLEGDLRVIEDLIRGTTHPDGEVRHQVWLRAVADGAFSFGAEEIAYRDKGEGSWKHIALGTLEEEDRGDEVFSYSPQFLTSDWKHFHDAVRAHRFEVVHRILPRYGICAA